MPTRHFLVSLGLITLGLVETALAGDALTQAEEQLTHLQQLQASEAERSKRLSAEKTKALGWAPEKRLSDYIEQCRQTNERF